MSTNEPSEDADARKTNPAADAVLQEMAKIVNEADPGSLLAELRGLLPEWTYFEEERPNVPPMVHSLLQQIGAEVIANRPAGFAACWTTPDGVWSMTVMPNDDDAARYDLQLQGKFTQIARPGFSRGQIVQLLRDLEVVR